MSRVITFARVFPKYHPKAGQPTFFVERLIPAFATVLPFMDIDNWVDGEIASNKIKIDIDKLLALNKKWHTIRAGHRWKPGDKFSPRSWSDKPYASKQVILSPDIEVVETYDVFIDKYKDWWEFRLNTNDLSLDQIELIANNDGLIPIDFYDWFRMDSVGTFDGQLIAWKKMGYERFYQ